MIERRIFDLNVDDYNNTAQFSKGHFGIDSLADLTDGANLYSDAKTDREAYTTA